LYFNKYFTKTQNFFAFEKGLIKRKKEVKAEIERAEIEKVDEKINIKTYFDFILNSV
jgi:hypothetical protein